MNRQRKVVITVTYNDLGMIVDTKAEELNLSAQPNLQPTCNQLATDLISRQDAIDAMARDIPFITFTEDPKRTAQRIIGTVPSADRPTGEWIPVRERLPEKDGCYLVSTTGTNNDIIDIAYYTEEIWHKASRIKAWMPLPEPYREDGE